jgi:hypothetical protein
VADWEPEEASETTESTAAREAEEMSAAEEVEVEMLQEILQVAMQLGDRLALERQRRRWKNQRYRTTPTA